MWTTIAIDLINRPTDRSKFNILHYILSKNCPNDKEIELYYEELQRDEELNMTHLIPKEDYLLVRVEGNIIADTTTLEVEGIFK